MADLDRVVEKEYDFYIYSSGDKHTIGEYLRTKLEQSRHAFRCLVSWGREETANRNVTEEICGDVCRSRWTLICLDDDAGDPEDASCPLMAALQENQWQQRHSLLLVISVEMDKKLDKSMWACVKQMRDIERFVIDFNKENYIDEILKYCTTLKEPVGCLAHGQVFSHFNGFWIHVLSDLEERAKELECYKCNSGRMSTKLYVILPSSAHIGDSLECKNPNTGTRIQLHQEQVTKTVEHVGKTRNLSIQVFKVSRGTESYYCLVDIPHTLQTIYLMGEHGIEGVDRAEEVLRFYYTANMLLNHTKNKKYRPDSVRLLLYNDKVSNKADILFEAVKSDLSDDQTYEKRMQPPDRLLSVNESELDYEHQVAIVCNEHVQEDRDIAHGIEEYLNSKNVNTCHENNVLTKLKKSRWHIFVISKEAMVDYFMRFMCQCSLDSKEIRAILILRGVMPYELPNEWKWAFVLNVTEPRYTLLKAMDGEPVRLEYSLPTGDVATGLAWGYVIQYLILTLGMGTSRPEEFTRRIHTFLKQKSGSMGQGCINRFYCLCPTSCTAGLDLTKEAKYIGELSKRCIEFMGSLEPYTHTKGAQKHRPYKLNVYKYTNKDRNQSICFVCEYSTPLHCLSEMTHHKFAGLLKDDMYRQCVKFVDLLPKILASDKVKEQFGDFSDIVRCIYYDDDKEAGDNLMDVLDSKIFQDQDLPLLTTEGSVEDQI